MLIRLRVKNYALIEDMDISFGGGLNILTGQTGAGKSILIGSLNLILGEKASSEMVRSGEEEAFVEASFDVIGNTIFIQTSADTFTESYNYDGTDFTLSLPSNSLI